MTESESSSLDLALSIPHIQESIFRHGGLSQQDLAKAARANRVWFQAVSPYLWENVNTTISKTQEWPEGFKIGLASHGQWTTTLCTFNEQVLLWCSLRCTRLLTIQAGPSSERWTDRNSLLKLVSQNSGLQVLRWHANYMNADQQFSNISPGLMNSSSKFLTTLELVRIRIGKSLCDVLNHHSATMNSLSLLECSVDSDTFNGLQNPRSNLKFLILDRNTYPCRFQLLFADHLLEFLKTMLDLIEFTLVTEYPSLLRVVPRALTEICGGHSNDGGGVDGVHIRPLGFLKTLKMGHTGTRSLSMQVSPQVLEALPDGLTSLTLHGFSIGDSGDLAILNFVHRQQDLLTSISFVDCQAITDETWQTILTTCRHLKVLESRSKNSVWETEVIMKDPWVCLNLERFEAAVQVGKRTFLNNGVCDKTKRVLYEMSVLQDCEAFFTQLSVLVHLQKLSTVISDFQQRRKGWSLKRSVVEDQLLLMWMSLKTCKQLIEVEIGFNLPEMERVVEKLKKKTTDIWEDERKIMIWKGIQ